MSGGSMNYLYSQIELNIYVTKTGKMRAAPRWHQRRGHWRTLASGRRVWVRGPQQREVNDE